MPSSFCDLDTKEVEGYIQLVVSPYLVVVTGTLIMVVIVLVMVVVALVRHFCGALVLIGGCCCTFNLTDDLVSVTGVTDGRYLPPPMRGGAVTVLTEATTGSESKGKLVEGL